MSTNLYHPLYESHPRVFKHHLKSTFVMTVHLDVYQYESSLIVTKFVPIIHTHTLKETRKK